MSNDNWEGPVEATLQIEFENDKQARKFIECLLKDHQWHFEREGLYPASCVTVTVYGLSWGKSIQTMGEYISEHDGSKN